MRIAVASASEELARRLEAALDDAHAIERMAPGALLAHLARGDVQLAVLDARDAGAEALCEAVRAAHPALPILALTSADDAAARVRALERGADDALSESWGASQVAARVGALSRRAALTPSAPEQLEGDGCAIDLGRAEASRDGRAVKLSAREVAILRWLARHGGRAASREELLEHVFGVSPRAETRSVDVAVAALRKKIERDPAQPRLIVSLRGLGYAWGPSLG
jgi:DNA-binding response OmpR family regulator